MTRMRNPPHPGEVLREYLGETTVTAAAAKLGVNRVTLNRIVTGASGISADMAYRLASAFGTSAELWAGMQLQPHTRSALRTSSWGQPWALQRPSGLNPRVHHMGRPVPQQHCGSMLGATLLGLLRRFDRATRTVRRSNNVVHGQQGVLRRRG